MKLCIPEKILMQHMAMLGKTGAGKSSALRHIVEYLLNHKKRVCVIDPKGDWWGLKRAADGSGKGYSDVIAFGDFKEPKATDIPINSQSGKHVAELIANGNRPCIIGFRGWMTGAMVRFWIDFASTLFNANSGELYLIGDEFHNFAPKGKIMDPEAGKCLHWSNRLMSEGRGYGLVCLIASQRPQKVHNDTLTCCETLVAMRVVHKADRDAVQDWIEGCGDMAKGKEVLNSLAGLPRGQGYVWSPEAGFGPELVSFPMFETFDSFAPPQLQKKVSDSGWSAVNLEDVKSKMASVIEEAKANDPATLKAEVRGLKSEKAKLEKQLSARAVLAAGHHRPTETKTEIREVPVLTDEDRKSISQITASVTKLQGEVKMLKFSMVADAIHELNHSLNKKFSALPPRGRGPVKSEFVTVTRQPVIRRPVPPSSTQNVSPVELPKAERAILRVLANFQNGKSKREIGVIAGYKHSGGGFNNAVGALRSKGFIDGSDPLRITDAGAEAYGPVDPLPSGEELFNYWINHPDLGKAEREILRVLVKEMNGAAASKETIAPLTISDRGTPYDSNGGGFNNAVGRLRAYELIEGRGELRAVDEFFQ